METSCLACKIKSINHPYLSRMEKHPKILETLRARPSQQGKIPTLEGFQFTTHHYINTKPHLFPGKQKLLSCLTIEFLKISHSLTWPSKGFWPIPHQYLLFGPFVLIPQVPIGVLWSLQLTDDFNSSSYLNYHLIKYSKNISTPKNCDTFPHFLQLKDS